MRFLVLGSANIDMVFSVMQEGRAPISQQLLQKPVLMFRLLGISEKMEYGFLISFLRMESMFLFLMSVTKGMESMFLFLMSVTKASLGKR